MPVSRSASDENVICFRHEKMFTARAVEALYPDYDPEKGTEQYEGTDRDAGWVLRWEADDGDETAIQLIVQAARYDFAAMLKAHEANPSAMVHVILKENGPTQQWARLQRMTVRWYGPYFVIARKWGRNTDGKPVITEPFMVEDETGSGDAKEKKTVHPLNGQVMPWDVFWMPFNHTPVNDGASFLLTQMNQRRGPAEEAAFRASVVDRDDAGEDADPAGEAGAGEGSDEAPGPRKSRGRNTRSRAAVSG